MLCSWPFHHALPRCAAPSLLWSRPSRPAAPALMPHLLLSKEGPGCGWMWDVGCKVSQGLRHQLRLWVT